MEETVSFPLDDNHHEPQDPPTFGQNVPFEIPPSPVLDSGDFTDEPPTSFTASQPFVSSTQQQQHPSSSSAKRASRVKKSRTQSKPQQQQQQPPSDNDTYLSYANKKKIKAATGKSSGIIFEDHEEELPEEEDRHRFEPREAPPVPIVDVNESYPNASSHHRYSWGRNPSGYEEEEEYEEDERPRRRQQRKPKRQRHRREEFEEEYEEEDYDEEFDEEEELSPEDRMRNLLVRWKSLLDDGIEVPKNFDSNSNENTVRKAVELGEAQLDEQTSVEFLQVIVVIIFWCIETGNQRLNGPLLLGDITKNIFLRVDKFNRSLRRIHRMYLSSKNGEGNPIVELGKQIGTVIMITHLTNMFGAALQDMSSSPIVPILSGLSSGTGDAAGIAQAATMAAGSNPRANPVMNMISGLLGNILNASNQRPPPQQAPPPQEVPMAQNTRNRDNKPAAAPPQTYNQEKKQFEMNMGDGLPAYTTASKQ